MFVSLNIFFSDYIEPLCMVAIAQGALRAKMLFLVVRIRVFQVLFIGATF